MGWEEREAHPDRNGVAGGASESSSEENLELGFTAAGGEILGLASPLVLVLLD